MKATVLMPLSAIWPLIAVAICESFCGVLNTQWRLASIGSTIAEEAAIAIIGVSEAAVDMAREISAGSRAAANLVFIVISPFRFHRCRLLHLLVFYSYQ